jgi:hypothetical protein
VVVRLGLRALSAPVGSSAGRQLRPSLAGRVGRAVGGPEDGAVMGGRAGRGSAGCFAGRGRGSPESVRDGGVLLPFICQPAELGRPRAAPAAGRAGPVARPARCSSGLPRKRADPASSVG